MADAAYPSWLEYLFSLFSAHTIKAAILGPGYVYSSAHAAPADLTDILGTVTLTGLTGVSGVIDADDALVVAPLVEAMTSVVVYDNTAGKLMLYLDQGVGFTADPDGNTNIVWSDTAGVKIFPLGGKP